VVRRVAHESIAALESGEHQYFRRGLRQSEAWRAYDAFRDSCAYLDIETDGGSGPQALTMIGLWSAAGYQAFVKGENLESFRDAISRYSMIVTFHGLMSDVPILERRFKGLGLDQIHVDLCPLMRRLGYRGGLKRIEAQCGIERAEGVAGLTGLDAVHLWRRHLRGDAASLERLLAYNRADVENLVPLAERAYREMCEQTLATD
jgi:uncharacterized protein YprB with RNaseH-like and TPR domain